MVYTFKGGYKDYIKLYRDIQDSGFRVSQNSGTILESSHKKDGNVLGPSLVSPIWGSYTLCHPSLLLDD